MIFNSNFQQGLFQISTYDLEISPLHLTAKQTIKKKCFNNNQT